MHARRRRRCARRTRTPGNIQFSAWLYLVLFTFQFVSAMRNFCNFVMLSSEICHRTKYFRCVIQKQQQHLLCRFSHFHGDFNQIHLKVNYLICQYGRCRRRRFFPNVKWKTEPIHFLNSSATKFWFNEWVSKEGSALFEERENFAICYQTDLGPRSIWEWVDSIWFAWKFSASDTAISAHCTLHIVYTLQMGR